MIQKSVYYLLFQKCNPTTDYFDYSLKSNWNASLTTWFTNDSRIKDKIVSCK